MDIIKRKQAILKGLTHYFTGKPCSRGHITKRYVANRMCCECQYYSGIDWRANNPDRCQEYRDNHRALHNKRSKRWRQNNPDKIALNDERRYGHIKDQTPIWYEDILVKRLYLKRDELNQQWNTKFTVDHIIPIVSDTVCGLHCWSNLQLLESFDNFSKHNTYQQDW